MAKRRALLYAVAPEAKQVPLREREQYRQMVRELRRKKADIVVIYDLSVVSNDPTELQEFLVAVQGCGAEVAVAAGPLKDASMDRVFAHVQGLLGRSN